MAAFDNYEKKSFLNQEYEVFGSGKEKSLRIYGAIWSKILDDIIGIEFSRGSVVLVIPSNDNQDGEMMLTIRLKK